MGSESLKSRGHVTAVSLASQRSYFPQVQAFSMQVTDTSAFLGPLGAIFIKHLRCNKTKKSEKSLSSYILLFYNYSRRLIQNFIYNRQYSWKCVMFSGFVVLQCQSFPLTYIFSPPLSVRFFSTLDKVYHKQKMRFPSYSLGQVAPSNWIKINFLLLNDHDWQLGELSIV